MSGRSSSSATRYGSFCWGLTRRTRWRPWTRIRSVPSGTLIILWTTATVPTEYRSSHSGGSASVLRTVISASIRSPETTSSISLIERSCPTARGVIDSGKTTVSFSGRTGRRCRSEPSVGLLLLIRVPRTTIATLRPRTARFAIGSVMRSIPASYVAVAVAAATSWPSGTWRSKCPYSISACW